MLRGNMLRGYVLSVYMLRRYMLREYMLRGNMLRGYVLSVYMLRRYMLPANPSPQAWHGAPSIYIYIYTYTLTCLFICAFICALSILRIVYIRVFFYIPNKIDASIHFSDLFLWPRLGDINHQLCYLIIIFLS